MQVYNADPAVGPVGWYAVAGGIDTGQAYTFQAAQTFEAGTSAVVPVTVQGTAGQTANLQEWRNSAGALASYVDPSGFINFQSPSEKVTVSATAATGAVTYDCSVQTMLYYTLDATANWTLNITNNGLAVGESLTIAFLTTQGATAYYMTDVSVDGVAATPYWVGGIAPSSGNVNSIDSYSFTLIKTSETPTYTVVAGRTQFRVPS